MESIESFKKRCESIIDKAYQGGVTLLNFLDDAEVGVLNNIIKKHPSINLFESGKIIDADRKRSVETRRRLSYFKRACFAKIRKK